jgi:predicted enzyme related to lactoylglutathione lyase
MIKDTMFVIAVPDLERSGAFYRDALGFTVSEIGDKGFRMFDNGSCRIFAGACPDAMPAADTGDHSYFAYLIVDDVEFYLQRALAAGAKLCKPIASEAWGMREFGLYTVDGHRIMIGQNI